MRYRAVAAPNESKLCTRRVQQIDGKPGDRQVEHDAWRDSDLVKQQLFIRGSLRGEPINLVN